MPKETGSCVLVSESLVQIPEYFLQQRLLSGETFAYTHDALHLVAVPAMRMMTPLYARLPIGSMCITKTISIRPRCPHLLVESRRIITALLANFA